ncbi:hypothetical protein VNO78_27181 [Psophocarpus tetragonolobus]|uniref:BURP domain-containing protein n=1 Tax=Psophocarpus tetragonolobus TaxID=3891 RepID=A0AAN9S0D6_PSOTE
MLAASKGGTTCRGGGFDVDYSLLAIYMSPSRQEFESQIFHSLISHLYIARMEFRYLVISFSILFFLAHAGESHGRLSVPDDEDLWQSVWPNTPIPTALRDLLNPLPSGVEIYDLPRQIDDGHNPRILFYKEDLHLGKTMKVQFYKSEAPPLSVSLWQKEIKDPEKEVLTFADVCMRNDEAKGEHRFCATSLGSLMGFAISKMGKNIQALSSLFVNKQEEYTVEGVQNLGDKAVTCHRLNFQKVAFYCHEVHQTTSFMVQLVAADGTKTQTLVVCHSDTSSMNHQLLQHLMGVHPQTKPVCHFLGNKTILWVPNLVMDATYETNIVA